MKVLQTLIFIFFPILIYLLIALGLSVDFKHLQKSTRKNKVLFGLVFLILSCIILPCLMANRNIYLNIILGRISYKDLEVTNYSIIINTLLAFLLGLFAKSKHQSISYKETALLMLLVIIGFIEVVDIFKYSYYQNNNLIISEVCRKEINEYLVNEQETKTEKSYITIYNPNKYDCYVKDLYLSTDEDNLKEDIVPIIIIPKKSTHTIYYEYGDFDISKSKETTIFLSTDRSKSFIDYVVVPTLEDDHAYTLNIEDKTWKDKKLNTLKLEEKTVIQTPTFDHESGFYNNPFNLYIDVPEGTKVYYTLDSSDPNENSYLYDGSPIYVYDKSKEDNIYKSISNVTATYLTKDPATYEPVDKCFVLRAIAIDENNNKSEIVTKSYFINLDKYKNTNVISLVSDPENLFDDVKGIYVTGSEYDKWYSTLSEEDKEKINNVGKIEAGINEKGNILYRESPQLNFLLKGRYYERDASIELYSDGKNQLNQNIGMRIQGMTKRKGAIKNLSLYSRKEYSGSKYFSYDLFNDDIKSHSVVLRQGDNNAFVNYLLSDRKTITTQRIGPVEVFLDGEYWSKYYIYDKYNKNNLSERYNLMEHNISVNIAGTTDGYLSNDTNTYIQLTSFIANNDLSKNDNYLELQKKMDIQSYIDFQCINIFLGNTDYTEGLNVARWKTFIKENNGFGDGRWRWALYDNDSVNFYVDTFTYRRQDVSRPAVNEQDIYVALKANDTYRKQFINTFMDLENTIFSYNNVTKALSSFNGSFQYGANGFIKRIEYINPCLEDEFNIDCSLENITVKSNNDNAGIIKLNSIDDVSDYYSNDVFTGHYYTDNPVELSVIENQGYEFNHWEVNGVYYSSDKDISVEVNKGGTNIYAIYD